jgi:hypothetical protein
MTNSRGGRLRPPTAVLAAFPLALLVAISSLAGIFVPSTFARETANWAAQGIGQGWFDLCVTVPYLIIAAIGALRGSRRTLFLLAGGFAYTLYEFLIYAFAVHFNAFFLVYCAGLGLSFFALAAISMHLPREEVSGWFVEPVPVRTVGVLLVAVGTLFALAWLGEIIPAIARGDVPKSVAESGGTTNPVHVIDLSVVLPLHLIAGVALMRRRPAGYVLAPVVLTFGVLMAASIAGMMLVMGGRGLERSWSVVGGMAFVSLLSVLALVFILKRLRG